MKSQLLILILLGAIQVWGQTPELIFHSGFEPNVIDTTNGVASDILGIDNSVNPPNDWLNDLENHPNIGTFSIQYEGGNSTMRLAEIVPDPVDPSNNVLKFWIKQPNVGGYKGRVQANLYGNNNIYNLFYSIRMYLPSDFDTLKYIQGEIKWLTLMEFWNNASWVQDYGFRVTVNLQKIGDSPDSLRLGVHAQTNIGDVFTDVWDTTNMSFVVPIAKWMTININYIEGDNSTGRFYLSVTPEGQSETTVFDITNYTHHPADPSPDGLGELNPFKLYTSDDVINGITNTGRLLHVYWDDFELWKSKLITSVANKNAVASNFSIYPNPTNKRAVLAFINTAQKKHTLKLHNIYGQLVRTIANITTDQVIIEKGNLTSGIYFYKLYNNKKISATGQLVFL